MLLPNTVYNTCKLYVYVCTYPPLQLLLTFEPDLIPSVASLLETVLKHNEERLSRLYSTGISLEYGYIQCDLPV